MVCSPAPPTHWAHHRLLFTTTMLRSTTALLTASLLYLSSCAETVQEDRPQSEILISASHHMFAFGGQQDFDEFPVPQAQVSADRGLLTLSDSGGYTVTRPSQPSAAAQDYALEKDGAFALLVPLPNAAPTRFLGAYQQSDTGDDQTQVYFFTDRYAPATSPSVGLFWGTRTQGAPSQLTDDPLGDWLLFSLHVIFSQSTVHNPDDVARAVRSTLSITENASPLMPAVVAEKDIPPGADPAYRRTESSAGVLSIDGGTASGFPDGAVSLNFDFGGDPRSFLAGRANDVILGLDDDETTGETGLVAMVRRTEFTDANAAQVSLAGTYLFGMHTTFVAPTNSGTDAANGTIEFNEQGGWQLDGIGSDGPVLGAFSYSGSYNFVQVQDPDNPGVYTNLIKLQVSNTNETWHAAIDQHYKVMVILDHEIEVRSPGVSPELSLALAIKRVEN